MNLRPIKAVLFDLDDTLWPITPVIARAEIVLHDWLRQHAPTVAARHSIDSLRARRAQILIEQPQHQINLAALRHAVLCEAFNELALDTTPVDAAMAVFSAARNQVQPFADVQPMLHRLHGRVLLGSITNGVADLAQIPLSQYFQASLAAHQIGCAKPAPAIFLAACQALGVAPQEAAYIGDDPELDVAAAQQAGLHGIWINRFERTLPPHIAPDAQGQTFDDLEPWLNARIIAA